MSLTPIKMKIDSWVSYEENKPRTPYAKDWETHNKYRSENDLDCVLLGGDLRADNIFSLWLPLRYSLVEINGYSRLNKIGNINQPIEFRKVLKGSNLDDLLPPENPLVKSLIELFELGQTKANMMLMPKVGINGKRSDKPYYDYTPYFLFECFEGGDFSEHFKGDDDLKQWIIRESLQPLFEKAKGEYVIDKHHLIDLSGTGDIKDGVPAKGKKIILIKNYISVLRERQDLLMQQGGNSHEV